jgi:uncharacterized protein YprB with RNaseH-like and TPR domain
MDLKAKLARLSGRGLVSEPAYEPGPPAADLVDASAASPAARGADGPDVGGDAAPDTRLAVLGRRLGSMRTQGRAISIPLTVPKPVGGAWLMGLQHTPAGPLCTVHHTHPKDFIQGRVPVGHCLRATAQHLQRLALDPTMAGVDPNRLLFVDTETTGLAGGSGTVPFLVGVAYFTAGRLLVEQWVLQRPGEEGPILQRLAACLAVADAIVTYNGKSFDWPLLRSRFILNRVPMPQPLPHLDLLHCTRRVLRRRQTIGANGGRPSMRLVNVERDLLGFCRIGDVPGAQIPELYFSYLRSGGAHLLDPVLEHNRHDLVSLAALLGLLVQRLDDVAAPNDDGDRLAMAELNVRGGATAQAMHFAEVAAKRGTAPIRVDACLLLAQLLVRQRRYAAAVLALRQALAPDDKGIAPAGSLLAPVHLALSKLFEHRLHDLIRAQHHAQYTAAAEGVEAQGRRLGRLARRLTRPTPPRLRTVKASAATMTHAAGSPEP